jgi:hypothetical protein
VIEDSDLQPRRGEYFNVNAKMRRSRRNCDIAHSRNFVAAAVSPDHAELFATLERWMELMLTPNLATRMRPGRAVATGALIFGLGLVRATPAPRPPIACPATTTIPTVVPLDTNAANMVGIYRSASCTLTLDASGTYVSDCAGGHAARYAIAGDHVVLEQPNGDAQHLAISAHGLVTADGTIYSITGGTP